MQQNTTAPTAPSAPVRVTVAPYAGEFSGWTVTPEWTGVDRPTTHSWTVLDRALADRLAAAVLAGAVYVNPVIATDVNGATYVQARSLVMGKYANADLRALGY